MKCIPLLIKVFIFLSILAILSACASKPDNDKNEVQVSVVNEPMKKKPAKVVSNVTELDRGKYQKALTYLQNGDFLQAENLLKIISAKYPDKSGPIVNLGIIAMKEGRREDAENLFTSAKDLNSDNPEILNYLGMIYRQQGKFDEAKGVYQLAIERDKSFSSAYLNLGILFDLYLSDYIMAKSYYQKYQELEPGDENVKTWLIDIDQRIRASN